MKQYLGIEFGSTRIKSLLIDEKAEIISKGFFVWEDHKENGLYSYSEEEIHDGLIKSLSDLNKGKLVECTAMGVSAMMHGYLALDKDGNLLTPFRTWRNENTKEASRRLTDLFGVNIPLRWSISHLYQALLNGEEHVSKIAYLTTLSSYIHYKLTGEKVIGIGDASGMFPVDPNTGNYDKEMLQKFDILLKEHNITYKLEDILPRIVKCGQVAGKISKEGALFSGNLLKEGTILCAPEGDAQTGMVATNSIKVRTGNVSAGTSAFLMVVIPGELRTTNPDVDIVLTPDAHEVVMIHVNECTSILNECARRFKGVLPVGIVGTGDKDLVGYLMSQSLLASSDLDGITHHSLSKDQAAFSFEKPYSIKYHKKDVSLPNLMKAVVYECVAELATKSRILASEDIEINEVIGSGGYFATPLVGQSAMSAALGCPISVMDTASEGGPWGIAVLSSYLFSSLSLSEYLDHIFSTQNKITINADKKEKEMFKHFLEND
ncbi:MAG: ATPase [Coprobacillus sp.]|nr:ATPase [Coprobacillus sp.]